MIRVLDKKHQLAFEKCFVVPFLKLVDSEIEQWQGLAGSFLERKKITQIVPETLFKILLDC